MKISKIIKDTFNFYNLVCLFIAYKFDTKKYSDKDIPKLAILKDEKFDIYIGRKNKWLNLPGSIWGNPFPVDEYGNHVRFKERMRVNVLETHMSYLRDNKALLYSLKSLSGKTLGCYCYSSDKKDGKWCHGHNLIQLYKEKVLNYPEIKLDYTESLTNREK